MKGIFYSRRSQGDEYRTMRYEFAPVPDNDVWISWSDFCRFFPGTEVSGKKPEETEWAWVAIRFSSQEEGEWTTHWDGPAPHHQFQVGEFHWGWSGCGITEHWFDASAVVLAGVGEEYVSGTGLTAGATLVVAYQCHVEVRSFREDAADGAEVRPEPGVVWAGFSNHRTIAGRPHPRSDWTGFALLSSAVGDRLDDIIRLELGELEAEQITCRHLASMQVAILAEDSAAVSRFLCTACRLRGVRLEEFAGRNRADMCPYFRRLARAAVDRCDTLPAWVNWQGEVASYRRLQDGEWEAFEVVHVRRRDGFVRRSVLLLNSRTREAWMYPYSGYVPARLDDFKAKYSEGRQTLGYMATNRDQGGDFFTEAALREIIAAEPPIWESEGGQYALLRFPHDVGAIGMESMVRLSIQKGEVAGLAVVPLTYDGEEWTEEGGGDEAASSPLTGPTALYADEEAEYFLLCVGQPWVGGTALRTGSQELVRAMSRDSGCWYLLKVRRP